jgi:hypothetical protein
LNLNFKNIIKPSKVAGVSVYYRTQSEYEITVCIIERRKGTLQISAKYSGLKDITQLKELVSQNTPVVISFLGKAVLNKEFSFTGEAAESIQYFPNNQENDFYCYSLKAESNCGISLCRRTIIDELLKQFVDNKFIVADITLGPYISSILWNFQLINYDKHIYVEGGELNYNSLSSAFHYSSKTKENQTNTNRIGDEEIESIYMVSYASGISWLLDAGSGSFEGEKPGLIVEGYKYKYIIDKSRYILLSLVFLVLIINFMAFESYRKRELSINNEMELNTNIISERDSLEKELKAKEEFIEYIGENKTYFSFYLDEIAASVPEKIVLEKIEINPLVSKIQKNEDVKTEKKIVITGLSSNSLALNQWNKQLAELKWVKFTNVISFEKTTESEMGTFILEMEIKQ